MRQRTLSFKLKRLCCASFATLSILDTRFQVSLLEIIVRIPASRAASPIPSISSMVNRIKGTEGSAADICCAVSMPVMSGIDKFSKTTSGFNF